ncbi:MAG: alkaline phosphatase family protein, partial [Anaerolineales bacterium]
LSSPTPAPTSSPTPTATSTITPSPSPSPTATETPTLTPTPIPLGASPERSRRIVIISIDGLRPDALQMASAPNILALAQRGAYTFEAQTIFPSVTLPAHAAMLSGYPPEAHGLTWNDYRPAEGHIRVPTIFSIAQEAGWRTAMVVGKEKFAHLALPDSVDAYVFARQGDQDVANQAITQAQAGFDVMFVHFPNTDYFGHLFGWMSERYIAEISNTDEAVGRLLAAFPEDTTVILSSDHGGHGLTHGANIPEDMTIPWIIAGPGVLADHALTTPVNTMDTAATALYTFSLSLSPGAEGKVVYEAYGQVEPGTLPNAPASLSPDT